AFAYWQTRRPLYGVLRHEGIAAGVRFVAEALVGIAIAGGALGAWRRAALAVRPPGPEWLALPLPPAHVGTHLRREARWAAALAALASFAAWLVSAPPLVRRALAFAGFLPACAMLGAWAIVRTCTDPASAMRPLPLSLRDLWRARATFLAGLVLALMVANA